MLDLLYEIHVVTWSPFQDQVYSVTSFFIRGNNKIWVAISGADSGIVNIITCNAMLKTGRNCNVYVRCWMAV